MKNMKMSIEVHSKRHMGAGEASNGHWQCRPVYLVHVKKCFVGVVVGAALS